MSVDVHARLAFHLTGRSAAGVTSPIAGDLRPALFARYHDLTALRHDFPVVLVSDGEDAGGIRPLSSVVDEILRALAGSPDADRVTAHVLRLERKIRSRVAREGGRLSELWQAAERELAGGGDDTLSESFARAHARLTLDGEVLDCDRALPGRLVAHAWRAVQAQKAARFLSMTATLVAKLSEILRADLARSDAGRTPASLRAAVGTKFEDVFDFAALSSVLSGSGARSSLTEARRARIRSLIATLENQRFYPTSAPRPGVREPFPFAFDDLESARRAHRALLPDLLEVLDALAKAELEIRGEYDESRHDAYFASRSEADLDPRDLQLFPDLLVVVDEGAMTGVDRAALLDLLSSGLPVKVLVQSDDLAADPAAGVGVRQRQLSTMAMGLNDVYVLQTVASQLPRERERIQRGLAYAGPALLSVYSGGSHVPGGPAPYLLAAAALESRAFPAIVCDPSAGPDWASRCDLEGNPQADRDWPLHPLLYEDRDRQRCSEEVAFTLLDLVAADPRYAAHFARVADGADATGLEPASAAISRTPPARTELAPFVWLVDGAHALSRAVVDEKLVREARRCRELWHSLQELGGVHNSFAVRALARERSEVEARARATAPVGAAPAPATAAGPSHDAAPVAVAEPPSPATAGVPERAREEPYIETPRCSTCNECVQLNGRMFAYNENRQAYIKDPSAGTFRELVEAAESCQVAIIHPGRPRDPGEPGLDELLERASAFD